MGLKSLLLQKMRSGLAALGIFIGTTTVIWLVAMGEGVSYEAQQQIMELGATNIIVRERRAAIDRRCGDDRVKTYGLLRPTIERILSNIPRSLEPYRCVKLKREFMVEGRTVDVQTGRMHRRTTSN